MVVLHAQVLKLVEPLAHPHLGCRVAEVSAGGFHMQPQCRKWLQTWGMLIAAMTIPLRLKSRAGGGSAPRKQRSAGESDQSLPTSRSQAHASHGWRGAAQNQDHPHVVLNKAPAFTSLMSWPSDLQNFGQDASICDL